MNGWILLALKVLVTAAFLAAGVAKLLRAKPLVDQFHEFRLPLEIMTLIGVLEVAGAVAVWFPMLTLWAFSGLACLMLGAMKSHFAVKHPFSSFAPSAVLFALCVAGALMENWMN